MTRSGKNQNVTNRAARLKAVSYESKAHLRKLGDWLIKYRVDHLSEALPKHRYLKSQQCQAAELREFLDFLARRSFDIPDAAALTIAQEFLVPEDIHDRGDKRDKRGNFKRS